MVRYASKPIVTIAEITPTIIFCRLSFSIFSSPYFYFSLFKHFDSTDLYQPAEKSTVTSVGNEQVPETNLIAYQGEHEVKNRERRVNNASKPERAWKIADAEHIGIQQTDVEDSSDNQTTYVEEITSDVKSGQEL